MLLPNGIFWHYTQVVSQIACWKKKLTHTVPQRSGMYFLKVGKKPDDQRTATSLPHENLQPNWKSARTLSHCTSQPGAKTTGTAAD